MTFFLEWKVILAAQAYWPAFFITEFLFKDMIIALVLGIVLVFFAWAIIWLVEFGPLGRNEWIQKNLHLHPHVER